MPIEILALCGSLRTGSSNLELLKAAKKLQPNGLNINIFDEIQTFPNYNPDLDFAEQLPDVIINFRSKIDAVDGLLIACPEYIHGLPGAFKNALDWIVSGSEIPDKPVAIFNAAPHTEYAPPQLNEILKTMSVRIITEAGLEIPMRAKNLTEEKLISNSKWSAIIKTKLIIFEKEIEKKG